MPQNIRMLTPVIGLNYLKGIMDFKRNPLTAMESFRLKYGDLPYFGGPLKTLFVFHPEDIKKVLVDGKNNNEKGEQTKLMKVALGDSLLIAEGEEWRKRKVIIQKVFHHQAILSYHPVITTTTENYVAQWKKKGLVNLSEEIMALTFQVSAKIFFGGISEKNAQQIRQAFQLMGQILAKKFSSPLKIPFFVATEEHLLLKEQIQILDAFIFTMIKNARKTGVFDNSFLGRLVSSDANLSDQQIRDEVVTFMGAGYETTATFVTWTLYLLLKNPDYLKAFKNSSRHALVRKNILQEGLRLYPSFPISARQNIGEMELGGKELSPRTNLLISPYITHRNPNLWTAPETFDPERYYKIDSETLRYQFIPFSIGPKKCIGEQLALEEAELIIESILASSELQLVSKNLNPICNILLTSDTPLTCFIH